MIDLNNSIHRAEEEDAQEAAEEQAVQADRRQPGPKGEVTEEFRRKLDRAMKYSKDWIEAYRKRTGRPF